MKKKYLKNLMVIIVVVLIVLSARTDSVLAAAKIAASNVAAAGENSLVLISQEGSESTEYPTRKEIKKMLGYDAKTVEKFKNGFIFDQCIITTVETYKGKEKDGSYKQLMLTYEKDKSKIQLFICKKPANEKEEEGTALTYKKIELRYVEEYHTLLWKDNDVNYSILAEDKKLTKDTLMKMAKEIIKKK